MAKESSLEAKRWWQKPSTWLIIFAVALIIFLYSSFQEDTTTDAVQPSPQVKVGKVVRKHDTTVNELHGLIQKSESKAVQVEILAKLREIEERLQAIEKCACKKPVKKAKRKPKAVPKPVVAPVPPAVVQDVPQPPKNCCEFSQPKPAIIKPGHMPLGTLPSAQCPNCIKEK